MTTLADLDTPCLLLDRDRLDSNRALLFDTASRRGVRLRPHLKTVKSVPLARHILPDPAAPVTVSTLREAEVFAGAGWSDILYAVGIAPQKIARVQALIRRGVDMTVILDSPEQARYLAAASRSTGVPVPALVELDSDGHRSGLDPEDAPALAATAGILAGAGLFRGVLTHCGSSYSARSAEQVAAWARRERDAALIAARHLRAAGHDLPVISIGSTPTVLSEIGLDGITELRAGVSLFFDLVQAGIGVCRPEDIAISVLATVIGSNRAAGRILTDTGWMALSRDRGTAAQTVDQGYGLVCTAAGAVIPDLLVLDTSQEHGILGMRPGSTRPLPPLAPGDRLRILPNHACATAAQHDGYHLVSGGSDELHGFWPSFRGW